MKIKITYKEAEQRFPKQVQEMRDDYRKKQITSPGLLRFVFPTPTNMNNIYVPPFYISCPFKKIKVGAPGSFEQYIQWMGLREKSIDQMTKEEKLEFLKGRVPLHLTTYIHATGLTSHTTITLDQLTEDEITQFAQGLKKAIEFWYQTYRKNHPHLK